jgi:quinol monooxygenase YgiN
MQAQAEGKYFLGRYGRLFGGCKHVYGLISKIKSLSGQREALISILLENAAGMPGCYNYVISRDAADSDAIWVTEVWENVSSHKASLSLPSVQNAIGRAKPIIAGFGERFETVPVGGHGILKS